MDFIQPIRPDRDVDPLQRVERLKDERERREGQQQRKKEQGARSKEQRAVSPDSAEGPVEGDDGHLHIDIRA
jgi:hypothetical protein